VSGAGERPLGRGARSALVLAAAATILLFYVVAFVSGALIAVVVVVLFTAMFGAARFGLSTFLRRPVKQHSELFAILARSFWLRTATTYRVPLQRADAPRLFGVLDDLSTRMGVRAPHEVLLAMHGNAWVRLEGYRQGAGRTILAVGYDLLAGLSEGQVRAVLAHEMAHAKLVQRGLSRWMTKGLGRLATLNGQVSAHVEAYRRAEYRSNLGEVLGTWTDSLTRRAARLVATYSRQDEFEADRGAAEICGGAAMRSALVRLESLEQDLARLPWNERIARVQLGESFSQWLVSEIARPRQDAEIVVHAHDPYSTHPALHDRLSALPDDVGPVVAEQAGIELLAEPDRVADRLMTEILRMIAEQERKDTKQLARSTRKTLGGGRARPLQWLAVPFIAVGLFVAIAGLSDQSAGEVLLSAVSIGAGVFLVRQGRYRDRALLPIPAFGTLTNARPPETLEEFRAAEQRIADELRKRAAAISQRAARLASLIEECYTALAARDYLRAHVAARLALEVDSKSVEAALGYSAAAGGLGNATQALETLKWVRLTTGLKTPNTKWGAVWALVMIEAWDMAEGLLALMRKTSPDQPTFLSLLALAQYTRGKLQSAISISERACAIEPANPHHLKLLIGILLTAGQVREAHKRLVSIGTAAEQDVDHMLSWVRLSLMQRDLAAARIWAERLRIADVEREWTITVGALFESARLDDDAAAVLTEALAAGYYPEAYIGLARIAGHQGDREGARRHLLSALNVERPLAPKAKSSVSLFGEIISRLGDLEERRVTCVAWLATFAPNALPAVLAGHSVLVFAADRAAAEQHVRTIVTAMQPEAPAIDVSALTWNEAPRDQQPVRPVQPGVQAVVA